MKIIVGLGNIGLKYEKNRHNTGFKFLDFLKENIEKDGPIKTNWEENKNLKALIVKILYGKETLMLVKPTTFMNLSGQSVSKILHFFKEDIKNLTIVYDDIDLPLGKIRIREKGSAGTHNGMKSILQELGTENFKRIRIGIESRGITAPKQEDINSFVLSDFKKEELKILEKSFKEAITQIQG